MLYLWVMCMKVERVSSKEIEEVLDLLAEKIDVTSLDESALNTLILSIIMASRHGANKEKIIQNIEETEHTVKLRSGIELLKKPIYYIGSFTRGLIPIRVNLEEGTYEILSEVPSDKYSGDEEDLLKELDRRLKKKKKIKTPKER